MVPEINLSILISLGAYYEGKYVGKKLAECVNSRGFKCENETHYDAVHGLPSGPDSLDVKNGWGIPDL